MPRRARLSLPNVPQHIIQRGNNRQACFYADEDYRFYLDWLREHAGKTGCRVHAYVLMTQSCPFANLGRTARSAGCIDESIGAALCSVCEPHVSPQRHIVGRPLPLVPDAGRRLPACLPALYRIESCACEYGSASWGIPLVELSSERAESIRCAVDTASAL